MEYPPANGPLAAVTPGTPGGLMVMLAEWGTLSLADVLQPAIEMAEMSLAFADRDFYYGDPYFPPEEPIEGLLSKEYARHRIRQIDPERNDPDHPARRPLSLSGRLEQLAHDARIVLSEVIQMNTLLHGMAMSPERVARPHSGWGTKRPRRGGSR